MLDAHLDIVLDVFVVKLPPADSSDRDLRLGHRLVVVLYKSVCIFDR